ncbi:uncharacterized protein IWZ02DRAFT_234718 [Phyllosticta citriasiana]|uniref:uncharacterized protein n=1 Tax=Phyllosticta citriasiana TaxID=595635 RepID=UPI0030FDD10E
MPWHGSCHMSPLQLPYVLVVICSARPPMLCARSAFSHSTSICTTLPYLALPYLTLGLCRQEPRTTVVLLHVTRRSPLRNAHVDTSTHVAKSSRLTSATNTPHLIAVCPRAVVAFTCLFWKSTHPKSGAGLPCFSVNADVRFFTPPLE